MNLEMDKQITVEVDQVVKNDGVDLILTAIRNSTGASVGPAILGGRERVNRNGKMTKRIKRNMRRDHGIALEAQLIQDIGNIMNTYSLSARNYIVEHTDDFYGTAGKFGDGDSCFQDNGCYSNHREAMEDSSDASVFRVYKSGGQRLGRAWVYHACDGAIVLFNGYGIALDKIALLASKLGDQEPRPVKFHSDVYVNNYDCYAIGGNLDRYDGDFGVESGYGYCGICDDELYENDSNYVEEHGDICNECYRDNYYSCDECSEDHHYENNPSTTVYRRYFGMSREEERQVCPWCLDNYYTLCPGCDERHRDNGMMQTSDDGLVCRTCYDNKYSECCHCDMIAGNDYMEYDEYGDAYCIECNNDRLAEEEYLEEQAELKREAAESELEVA